MLILIYFNMMFIDFLDTSLKQLKCNQLTKSYIINVLNKYQKQHNDLSNDSITILYQKATEDNNFVLFQNIADWIFFIESIFPDFHKDYKSYAQTIGQLSYYKCYKLINKQIYVYENMADEFKTLTRQINFLIHNN